MAPLFQFETGTFREDKEGSLRMNFAENAKFRRSSNVVSRQIGSELVVVPIRGGVGELDAVFSFNGVGSDVWALMESDRTLGELAMWVVEHYEASQAQVEKDLSDFLGDLVGAGLATVAPVPFSMTEPHANYASR